ncbi:hypothetical protein [uncultured Lentibacter sp.]|uniref:hypothetical protein n=1 Tax=uncultured Lentibacter sp. TaxID=1659309 RepID=UPI002627C46B|nr:hypothetical protein [uncultured Lentibacter sp.]
MKFKLTSGDSIFSFEGELQEAQALLDAYWKPQPKAHSVANSKNEAAPPLAPKKSRAKRAKSAPTGAAATSAGSISINAQELANKIKTSENFAKIKSRILDVKADWVTKCKLVGHFADEPITSGDVHRTMDALKVKNSLSTLSTTLSNNADKFLTKGDNPVKYELTSAAETEFLNWLTTSSDD